MRRGWVLVAAGVLGLCASAAAAAPAAKVPDFSGLFDRIGDLWLNPGLDEKSGAPVQRLEVKGPDAEDIWAGNADNPILQPWARAIVKKNADSEMRLQHVYTADDSCWPSGVPQAVNLIDKVQFVQGKDRVLILYQRDHQVRHVYLRPRHSRNLKPSWYGESIGHYENGDTLVVDTVGMNDKTVVDPFGTPHTVKLHVVERYRLFDTPFGEGLDIEVRVDDSGAFTKPWTGTAEYRQDRTTAQLEEFVCAENDRSFPDGSTFGTLPTEQKSQF